MGIYKHTRTKLLFLFVTIFLVTLSIISYIRIDNLIHTSKLVNHTNVVKLNLRNTFSILLEMEANQRGYIITKDSSFLKPYFKNVAILEIGLVKIGLLTKDNASQQINTATLLSLVNKRKVYLQSIINEAGGQRITTERMLGGKALMDNVRQHISKMESEEDRLLEMRSRLLNKELFLTPILTFSLILSAIIILIATYFKIIKDLRVSDTLRSEIEKTNKELELKNKELEESEERFFKIFDNNPVALSFGELGNNKIVYANKLFYSYFGYSEEEVIGRTSEELKLVSDEENARLFPIIMSYLEDNRSLEELQALPPAETEQLLIKLRQKMFGAGFEVLYTRKNKETFFALVFYEIIAIGNKKFALTSYQDITDRKKTEKKIETQNEELVKINKELESFTYISSHDLQEPLRKIQVFSSQIAEKDQKNLSDKGKDLFKRIQDCAFKMQTLIQDLLTYSRTTASERKFENIDISTIILEVKEDLKDELLQKNASIETGKMCELKIIPFQFRQLIYNLISNSLKFSVEGRAPEIKIKSEMGKAESFNNKKLINGVKYCRISVADNGIGFESEYSERIFEVFQRLHRKTEYAGTGIGLAIVKKIVENHNGDITVESSPGKGSTFHIYIPVT
ncbi:MAG: CHASE3 domain-containing protein [Bacteroidetes bacterium]|nr:CHASE3 domain-containing protein [Bacteroidota bacterium]